MSEFKCSGCEYKSSLKVHVKRHINKKIKCNENNLTIIEVPIDIICKHCNKNFSTFFNLDRHVKTCKSNLKDLKIHENRNKFMYILQEREFINTDQNVYKLGITGSLDKRMGQYPIGSRIIAVIPVDGNPKLVCLKDFRVKFTRRIDIGSEYFEGDINIMVRTLINNCC